MLALEQIQIGHILIDSGYYYQPHSDNEPYFIGYTDLDDDTIPVEGLVYATKDTKEEAEQITKDLVKAAETYCHSLLRTVYTFTEYLDMKGARA